MWNKIINYIKGVGGLELMVALFPIVAGYNLWGTIWCILMVVIALNKKKNVILKDKVLYFCFGYVILHEFAIFLINDFDATIFNHLLSITLYLLVILIVTKSLDFNKLVHSLTIVAIIAAIGLIFQFGSILRGEIVSPIALPFLPAPKLDSRLYAELGRPSSFFWEPAAYITFIMFPLFVSLTKKQIPLTIFLFFSILLSTSSNGIIMAPVMIALFVLTSNTKKSNKFFVTLVLVAMVIFFFQSNIFDMGKEKIDNTELSENVRIANGPNLVAKMPTNDLIVGIPDNTVVEYLKKNHLEIGFYDVDAYFLSDFWHVLINYGVVGLFFYILIYFRLLKLDKSLIPYISVLLIALFTQSVSFRSMFVYQMVCVWSYVIYNKNLYKNV